MKVKVKQFFLSIKINFFNKENNNIKKHFKKGLFLSLHYLFIYDIITAKILEIKSNLPEGQPFKMKEKKPKIKPYHPLPFREGNTVNHIYQNVFLDRVGNLALIKKCDYKDKKKKINEGYALQVKWIAEGQYFTKEKAAELNACVVTGEEKEKLKKASFIPVSYEPTVDKEDPNWIYVSFEMADIYFFEHKGTFYLNYYWDFSMEENNEFVFFEIGSKEEALVLNNRLKKEDELSFQEIMGWLVAKNKQPIFHSRQMTHDFIIGGVLAKIHVNAILEKYKATPYCVSI